MTNIDHDALARRIATAVATKSGFRPGPALRKRLTNAGKLGRDQEFHCHETLVASIVSVLREALPTSEEKCEDTCKWIQQGDPFGRNWMSGCCGEFRDRTTRRPSANGMTHCCFCGRIIEEVSFDEDKANES